VVGPSPHVRVPTGGTDGAAGDEQSRPGKEAFLDRLSDSPIGAARIVKPRFNMPSISGAARAASNDTGTCSSSETFTSLRYTCT
jgi:hypothetical protein